MARFVYKARWISIAPLQEMYDGVYFPIPSILERFLVPMGDAEIRLDLHCEWIDMRTSKLWEAETPTA